MTSYLVKHCVWVCLWVCFQMRWIFELVDWIKQFSPTWKGTIQPIESLNRTKRRRNVEFALCLIALTGILMFFSCSLCSCFSSFQTWTRSYAIGFFNLRPSNATLSFLGLRFPNSTSQDISASIIGEPILYNKSQRSTQRAMEYVKAIEKPAWRGSSARSGNVVHQNVYQTNLQNFSNCTVSNG